MKQDITATVLTDHGPLRPVAEVGLIDSGHFISAKRSHPNGGPAWGAVR